MSNEYKRNWAKSNSERKALSQKQSMVRCRYGITPEEVETQRIKQNNKCAICKERFSEDNLPYIDHDHSSGWFRGLLCRSCNFAIGLLKESAEFFQTAADYVIENATPTEFNFSAAKLFVRKSPGLPKGCRIVTKETRNKQSASRMGAVPWNKGRPLSEEHKSSLSKPKGTGRRWLYQIREQYNAKSGE